MKVITAYLLLSIIFIARENKALTDFDFSDAGCHAEGTGIKDKRAYY